MKNRTSPYSVRISYEDEKISEFVYIMYNNLVKESFELQGKSLELFVCIRDKIKIEIMRSTRESGMRYCYP